MITHTGQILNAATANQHDAMLLQRMPLVRNVGNNFLSVGQPDLGNFSDRGIRFFGSAGHHLDADTTAKRIPVQSWGFGLRLYRFTSFTDQLVYGRHGVITEVGILEKTWNVSEAWGYSSIKLEILAGKQYQTKNAEIVEFRNQMG